MDRLTDEQLAAIEAADKARTPGEWWDERWNDSSSVDDYYWTVMSQQDDGSQRIAKMTDWWAATANGKADAAFIALASWAIPALVAEVRRLRQENAALGEKVDANGNR